MHYIVHAGRNINNLRYANNPTLMAESEKELKNLLMEVKEESEKASLKFNSPKTKIRASGPITLQQISESVSQSVQSLSRVRLSATP